MATVAETKQEGRPKDAVKTPQSRQAGTDAGRILAAPLGAKLLGQEMRADLYVRNGFRLLGVSACADRQTVLKAAARLQTMVRISPKAISRFAIGTGYDHELEKGEIQLSVSRLQDPRHRIVQEVFWPHVANGAFAAICQSGQLTSPEVLAKLEALAEASDSDRERAQTRHALAVAFHNLALAGEIGWLIGESMWDAAPWGKALAFWGQVISEEPFWEYLRERATAFADPRLRPADIDQIRSELPSVVLGFNLVLGRHYAQSNDAELCRNHLDLMAKAGLPVDAVNACLRSAVKSLAVMRLEPLVRRAEDPFGAASASVPENHCPKCGNPLYAIEDESGTRVRSLCRFCDVEPKICPNCGKGLPKPTARACKSCKSRWTTKIGRGKEREPAAAGAKLSRLRFDEIYRPILDEAFAVRDHLTGELGLDPELVARSEFDRICEAILDAVNSKIDYDNPNRGRDILYSILITRQLLSLPLSTHVRRKIERSLRSDRRILYRGFEVPSEMDVAECWFAEGEEADPDASLLFHYHKITNREVNVDVLQGSAGVRVSYESRQVLVPRSARAQAVHEGKSVDKTTSRRTDSKDSLFAPPSSDSPPPFAFGTREQAGSILDVLEYCSKHWKQASKYLADGSLPDWFNQRGQTALAAKLRACAQDKPDRKEALAALRTAAAAEVDDAAMTATIEADRQVQEKESEAAENKRSVETQKAAELRAYDEDVAGRRTELEADVGAARAQRNSDCEKERQEANAAAERERVAAAGPISEAEEKHARGASRHRGMRGVLRWELPFGSVGVGCGVAAARLVPADVLARVNVSGLPPEVTPGIIVCVVGGAVLGGVALIGANAVRAVVCAALARPLKKLERDRDRRCARALDAGQAKVAEIAAAVDPQIAKLESELQDIARGRTQIVQAVADKLGQISSGCETAVRGFRKACSQRKRELEQRLTACLAVKSKSDASDFPALKKAKSNGYKSGKEPSSAAMQMSYSEEQEARSKLQMAMRLTGRL